MVEFIRRILMALLIIAIGATIAGLCFDLAYLAGQPSWELPGTAMGVIVGVFTGLRAGNMLAHGLYLA